eukprot:3788774-Pyramimonas_sp.AAC.1
MSARPSRGSHLLPPLLLFLPLCLRAPKIQSCGRSAARSPRDARRSPRAGPQRRARVVRCAEQKELAGWLTAGKAL